MAWVYLIIAGILEATWIVVLKLGHSTDRYWPKLLGFAISIASFSLMNLALQKIPMGTSYVVWTGIGAVGTTILGVLCFAEPLNAFRILCMLFVISGLVGLKLTSSDNLSTTPPDTIETKKN